ncbi:hypothetical protein N7495_008091 [Penicillium taxi]|uniref:uncharacterized protein n=1 Tax=Penicillium taxi TaxID=168475 RepID=UPI002545A1D4|nr:uncharacterized protein N7495_008091 [Penicillium taxi]KAJ5888050.1 hypothetical protein N7495_008091 [Penicillium taxi]
MPRTTRSAPAEQKAQPEIDQQKTLIPAEKPNRTFILPASASKDARVLSLPDPRSGNLAQYFFCSELGVYEFTAITAPSHVARSIFATPSASSASDDKNAPSLMIKKGDLLVATPIDPIFILIPLLLPSSNSGPSLFQPLDDIIDSHDDLHPHLRSVLFNEKFRTTLLARAEAICDTVEAGDERMLRLSETKLLKELVSKSEILAKQGLPASLEQRFIRQALAAPLMSVKRNDIQTSQLSNDSETTAQSQERQDSPSISATTVIPSISTPVGETIPAPQLDVVASSDPVRLLQISTALSFIKESYLSPALCSRLDELLTSPESPLDLTPLTNRLKELADLRAEALATRKMSDFTLKRSLDDEEVEARAEKKRRKEEEEKKSKAESRGVRDLKKVNTTGMKKMSDFFSKAASKKKS